MCERTLSGGLVVARVEGSRESGRGVGDVPVEVAASAAVCEHSHAQHQDDAEQQRPHQTGIDRYAHTRGQSWKRGDTGSDGQDVKKQKHMKKAGFKHTGNTIGNNEEKSDPIYQLIHRRFTLIGCKDFLFLYHCKLKAFNFD